MSICVDASACKGMLLRHGNRQGESLVCQTVMVARSCESLWSASVQGLREMGTFRTMLTHSVVGSTVDVLLEGINHDTLQQHKR